MKLYSEKNKQRFINILNPMLLSLIILFIMFLHGTLPFIEAQSVPVQAVVSGTVKCIVDKGSLFSITCLRLGFPIGYRVIYGYPSFFVSAFLYKFLSINPVDGLQIFDSICIILGSVSLYIGIKRITNNPLSGLLAPLLFYISPFMVNLGGGALYQGFVLLPFCLGVSILIFSGLNNQLNKMVSLRFSFLILLQFLLLLALIWMDGYSYIMTITAIIIFCLVDFIWLFLKNKQINIQKSLFLGLYLILLFIPGLIYRAFAFPDSLPSSSLDFFRGEGIDLITLMIPTQIWLHAKLFGVGIGGWNAYAFYGDGSNAAYNYLGVLTICIVLASIFIAIKGLLHNQKIIITLFVLGLVGFTLSLGPSLKINNVREEKITTAIAAADYTMKPEEALLSLPTAFLYKLPVISTMRATFRWQLLTRLAITCIICLFVAWLYKKSKLMAALLFMLLIFENLPSSVFTSYQTHVSYRQQRESFNSQVVSQLSPYIQGKKVLFLPASNDFLVSLIVPFTNSYSYNVFFDKEVARIRPLQPIAIIKFIDLFAKGNLRSGDVCSIFRTGLIDKVIFLNFNPRLDVNWPPPEQRILEYQKRTADFMLEDLPELQTIKHPLFLIVSPNPNMLKCMPKP